MESNSNENPCVFELITALCNKVAGNYAAKKQISQRKLASKMRSHAYEVLLRKSEIPVPPSPSSSLTDLWTYYYVLQSNAMNISDYKRSTDLKAALDQIKQKDFGENKELVHNVLKLLVLLNGPSGDSSTELYQRSPFSFGILNEMLPRMKREPYGSPQPYPHYPSHIFELPFSLKHRDRKKSKENYSEYFVETFESKSLLPETQTEYKPVEIKSFLSHISHRTPAESTVFNYPRLTMARDLQLPKDSNVNNTETPKISIFDYPRLTTPRDLVIPKSTNEIKPAIESSSLSSTKIRSPRDLRIPKPGFSQDSVKVTFAPSDSNKVDIREVYRAMDALGSVDIWEVASRMDKDVPNDIWDVVSKLPSTDQRDVIATSRREMVLWRQKYSNQLSRMNVISEREFIRHLMYLIIGVETKSFYCGKDSIFFMKENLILEGISQEILEHFIVTILDVGTLFKRLHDFAFGEFGEPTLCCPGLITEAVKEATRQYLLEFRLKATSIFEGCFTDDPYTSKRLPTLLQVMHHVEGMAQELATVAKIMKMGSTISLLPEGGELLSYLYKNTSIVTQKEASLVAFTLLFSVCKVYFKFIEKFIFEGELDDRHGEFFIKTDPQHINSRSKKYWDSGFFISFFHSIPDFMKDMTKCILLCGKTLRLFKLCNPGDPLALLISSDHPRVKCCSSFEELQRQQRILDVYRTRCMFVSGERVTFEQILLKREAERKAFTEMASLKQAETFEKIIAERKRLAQLIMAEKQHSFKVLEAAMREAEAAKNKRSQREKLITKLEKEADRIAEEVDAKLVEGEKNKIMEYYSKLNMEVEKSQRHTEWKIKRLQLNQSRIQLLSTEERNLKHEKLELEHTSIECMSMSVQSDMFFDARSNFEPAPTESALLKSVDSAFDFERKTSASYATPYNGSDDNILQNRLDFEIDVITKLDQEGNVLPDELHTSQISSATIGDHLNSNIDNLQYLKNRKKALMNKQKVQSSELTDRENNITDVKVKLPSVDEENNVEDGSPNAEARRNKRKVLGDDFNKEMVVKPPFVDEENNIEDGSPNTEARRNKRKVLGDDFNKEMVVKPPFVDEENNIEDGSPNTEARRNKRKVLGDDFNKEIVVKPPFVDEENNIEDGSPNTEARRNKRKVLGDDFNKEIVVKPPFVDEENNIEDGSPNTEARRNKKKVLGDDFNKEIVVKTPFVDEENNIEDGSPNTEAQRNKRKVLGDDFNKEIVVKTPFVDEENNIEDGSPNTEAQRNKRKVLGDDFNKEIVVKTPFVDEENSIEDGSPNTEARRNKRKVLGDDFKKETAVKTILEPRTEAQKQALINKQKVLGVEYNLIADPDRRKEPQNFAQEQALKNRKKILDCDSDLMRRNTEDQGSKRAGLKLNLKVISEPVLESPITPFNIATTPNTANILGLHADFPRLDIETPTTAEIPQFHDNINTPQTQSEKDISNISFKSKKPYNSVSNFNFSLLDDDIAESEVTTDSNMGDSTKNSPSKQICCEKKKSTINFLDGTYTLENIDPFGLKQIKSLSEDKLDCSEPEISVYEHAAAIIEQTKLKPSKNIFAKHFGNSEDDDVTLDCNNISTLTACLQRSVMLPLTYQLEVVNNAILSHFLVNLDLYEHLRSLKDYFFLGDGEFSRSISHNLFIKLRKTINPEDLLNFSTLHNILDKALGSSISHVNKFSENLSFAIGDTPLSFHHSSPDVLYCVSLTYAVEWPLNIILSNEALARYAKVFQFLIKMRRIAWVLGEDFEVLKQLLKLSRNRRNLQRSPQYITLQLYRHNMASLIRALDSYIITTSIQSSWNEFETDLKKARTLDDLYECHVVYVKKVLFRCLLNNRSTPVMSLLNDMFTVVLKFSRVLQAGKWNEHPEGHFTHQCFHQMEELYHIFEKLTNYLHSIISKLMEYGYQRHLAELLTMINLNGYYDRNKYKGGGSLASISVATDK